MVNTPTRTPSKASDGNVGEPHEDEDHFDPEEIVKEEPEEEWEKGIPPFVRKLTKMVVENDQSIDWTQQGSFVVKELDQFTSSLLPKYFKSIKFCSFVRQLNMYNFHKVEDAPNSSNKSMEFNNPNFLPGRKDLLKKIHRRKTVKRNKDDDTADEDRSPKPQPSSGEGELAHISYKLDETSYKGLLHAVLKLQQQNEISQLALKQVLDELNMFKKAHYELEQKVASLTLSQHHHQQHTQTHSSNGPFSMVPLSVPGSSYNMSSVQYQTAPQMTSSMPIYQSQQNLNYNVYPTSNDISTLLFGDDTPSASGNGNGLLNLSGGAMVEKTFDFNGLQQHLGDSNEDASLRQLNRNGLSAPLSLYDNNTARYDVF